MDSSTSTKNDANMWAMLCHIAALAGCLIPVGNIIGPLIIWQMKKAEFPAVDDQGKESLNFQITVTIGLLALIVLAVLTLGLLMPLLPIFGIVALVFTIIGGLKANKGELYRYPFAFRFVK